jgi:hypothetical protein
MSSIPPTTVDTEKLDINIVSSTARLPLVGELIKLRFQQPISGPASSISTSAPSSARRHGNWHSALVTDVQRHPWGMQVTAHPIPTYSKAEPDAVSWMVAQPKSFQAQNIPLGTIEGCPHPLGLPLRFKYIGTDILYKDRKQSWIRTDSQTFTVENGTKWKSFSPNVVMESVEEMRRFQAYLSRNVTVNFAMMETPLDAVEVYRRLGQDFKQPFRALECVSDDDDDEEEDELDLLDELRLWPTKDETILQMIADLEAKRRTKKLEEVAKWVDGVLG